MRCELKSTSIQRWFSPTPAGRPGYLYCPAGAFFFFGFFLGLGVSVGVEVDVWVGVGLGVTVGVEVGVEVVVGVAVGVGVEVGVGVRVSLSRAREMAGRELFPARARVKVGELNQNSKPARTSNNNRTNGR